MVRFPSLVHLFVPPSLRRFEPRRVLPSQSLRFMALEYDLVAALRPRLVVDLGAGDAVSFFTFCQSMHDHEVDGVCYAIDAWEGTGNVHPLASFEAISEHGRSFYPGIHYLVKAKTHDARRHFSEESIDLLRVDGTRPDVIAGADVEAWYRRVRPGGLIVWHGTARDARLWGLIAGRCRTVVFGDGSGLGVASKLGERQENELFELLFTEQATEALERLYRHAHEHHELRRILSVVGDAGARPSTAPATAQEPGS